MRPNTLLTIVIAIAMVTSMAVAGTAAQTVSNSADAEAEAAAYAGSHVEFNATDVALVDYRVDGDGLIGAVEIESASEAEQRLGIDIEASAVADVEGSAISIQADSETRASMTTESGATVDAHDSPHGHLLISANGDAQLVGVELEANASAEQADDTRVVVTKDDGTTGTFIVVGDGEVAVNDDGGVTAHLEGDASLVYKQYDERNDADEEQERLIADGTAAAEVYLSGEAASDAEADVVQYAEDTTVTVVSESENEIRLTAERAESEGRIVIANLNEAAFDTADGIDVHVDGEAAVEAESMSELEAAADGGDDPAYMVRHSSTATASAEVLVALNHFSERDVTMQSGDGDDADGTNGDTNGDGDDDDIVEENPGFGALIAGLALALIALLAVRLR